MVPLMARHLVHWSDEMTVTPKDLLTESRLVRLSDLLLALPKDLLTEIHYEQVSAEMMA